MAVFRRAYRVRPLAAVLLCLPGILLCVWYAWKAYASFDRYRRIAGEDMPLTVEDFHIQLFDALRGDLRRMLMNAPPDPSRIERFSFHMDSDAMAELLRGASLEEKRPYVPAEIERNGKLQPLRMRLRGQQHWHLLGKQKSIKVKLPKGKLLDGHRVFNLINDPMPMVVGEQLILDLAGREGVLTPESKFARVSINGADLGVFHYETQPDESLLRVNKRMPGSMYSGNLPGSAETQELWTDAARWAKTAWRNDAEEAETADLERFLKMVSTAPVQEFVDFARHEMDLDAFATFDALDVAFGGNQHDWRENHKLYFDPYRGRWEPVAWNFRGFRHDPSFNLVDNPILLRLKQVPEYVSLRNRRLYELLVGKCSVASVRKRGFKMLKKLAPELASDPHWHSYKLLPRITRFHRRMVRPMNLRRAAMVFESEMTTYTRRSSFLLRELRQNPLFVEVGPGRAASAPALVDEQPGTDGSAEARSTSEPVPAGDPAATVANLTADEIVTPVRVVIDGRAGVELAGFVARWNKGCEAPRWRVLRGDVPVTAVASSAEAVLKAPLPLYPSVRTVARDGNDKRGDVRTEMVPAAYPFTLESTCALAGLEARGRQLATSSRVRSRPASEELLARLPDNLLEPGAVPTFAPGEVAPHPAALPLRAPVDVALGPGDVAIGQTRVFGAHETVSVAPGTRLRIAPGASLVFLGKVTFGGTRSEPIVIEPAGQTPWGGIALQGRGTRGSSFTHVVATGGSVPQWRLIPYPGMINLHDTREITIRECRFGRNQGSDDVVHAAYVKALTIEDTVVEDAAMDAFDLEYARAAMRNIQVLRTGDEALDLMASRVDLRDSILIAGQGSGISAGEESQIEVRDTLVASAKVGVLAKNASVVDLAGSLLFRNQTGVRVYQRTVRYAGDSEIRADVLFVVGSELTVKRDKDSKQAVRIDRIRTRLPQDGSLDHLQRDVLGLEGWGALAGWVTERTSAKSSGGGP